jgi:hypothetical protein
MDNSTLEKLKRRGHNIGMAAVTHDGKMIIAVDGRMLTYPEIDQLLEEHVEKENAVAH